MARRPSKRPSRTQRMRRTGPLAAFLRLLNLVILVLCLALVATAGPNLIMFANDVGDIRTEGAMAEEADEFEAEAIFVLGASVNPDGTPSDILRGRLDTAIELYEQGVAPKIIMSGDNSDGHYNEVMNMCNYAVEHGVDRDDVFCDHAGINTYDSMYRARHVFGVKRMVVVTNAYHLYRSMYLAKSFSMFVRGVASDKGAYDAIDSFEKREYLARIKDFYAVLFNAEPATYSSPVSLDQSGTVTQWWKKASLENA